MSTHIGHQHHSNHPPTTLRPTNISTRPNSDSVIYVETAMPPPLAPAQYQQNQNASEVAGVLRRNQACLNCRRRKLKCSAERPNCSTCIRSHKHLMRTAPNSNPVLTCEYDDGPGNGAEVNYRDVSLVSDEGNDDADGSKKKKRKASGDPKKKNRKDEEDDETERLRKKIEALEAQLAKNNDGLATANQSRGSAEPNPSWSAGQRYGDVSAQNQNRSHYPDIAPSPTAFLEMLSSAASAQMPEANVVPGLRNGALSSAMMTGAPSWAANSDNAKDNGQQSTGLTPFLSFSDSQAIDNAAAQKQAQERQPTEMSNGSGTSRRTSQYSTGVTSDSCPAGPSVLSPNNFFNFSPGPSGPTAPGPTQNLNWAPPPGPDGQIQPSTRTEGPWRAVETVDTVLQGIGNPPVDEGGGDTSLGQSTDVDMDPGFPPVDEAIQQQLLMDLFWPGWPPNLPEPHIVNELAEAFFELVPNLNRLLHRARFLARLALPPTHPNFPHPALVHAMCASSAAWCAPAVYQRGSTLSSGDGYADMEDLGLQSGKSLSFGLKQAAYGKEAVQDGLNTGNRLFDVVRAMIILSRVFIDDTRMLECWAYAGLVARMLLPLGLNVRSAELSLKSVMLPPPADALEREERRAAVWMAFYHDTIASSASGWGTSMALDELSVPLPVSSKDFEIAAEHMEPNPQDTESPDFWTKHPVPDPFVMVVKASILMNRVNRFVRKWKNRHLREEDDCDGLQRPEFREIANAIACFQMSFPPSIRNPCKLNSKKRLDIDVIAAQMLPHAAIICLYEPFADVADPNDSATRRLLGGAQGIVSIIQQLASVVNEGAQNFTSVMHSSASVCLVTAARTCLLFYRFALNINDYSAAESHRMDIEMCRMALGQFGLRFKIGHHHAQLIEYFLDRATNPTIEKLQAHYPDHPRPGAPELHHNAHLGVCVINALNVKRGYWRIPPNHSHSSGVSPLGSTPESATYASSAAGHGQSSSASGSNKGATVRRMDSDSPRGAFSGAGYGSTGDGPRRSEMRRSSSAKDVEAQVTCQSVQEQSKAQGLQTFPPTVDLAPDVGKMFDSHSTIMNGQRASFWGTHPVEGGSIAKSKLTPKVEKRFDSIPSVVFEQKQGSWTGNWGSRPQGDEPVQSGPVNAHSHVYTTMPEAEAVAKT